MVAHSYWRLWFDSKDGSNFNYQALYSLDFQDSGGTSLCTGGTAFSSSDYAGFHAANAFGPTPTGWTSNNELPCSLGYHFAAPVTPAKIAIAPWNNGNYPVLIIVQSSDDGATWTDEYLISKPVTWINQQVYTMTVPTGVDTAQYWMMYCTVMQNGLASSNATVAEMRFLDNNGNPFTGFTDTRGTFNNNSGNYSWNNAWNNDGTDYAYASNLLNNFCQVMYPSPVQVLGMYIRACLDGFYMAYTPAAGRAYSSTDGMIWGRVWNFGPANATGLPIATGGVVSYNAPAPPPATMFRRAMLLS